MFIALLPGRDGVVKTKRYAKKARRGNKSEPKRMMLSRYGMKIIEFMADQQKEYQPRRAAHSQPTLGLETMLFPRTACESFAYPSVPEPQKRKDNRIDDEYGDDEAQR